MNEIDERLLSMKSRIVMTVHDELPTEVHESEVKHVPHMVQDIMEASYKPEYIPVTVGMEWSDKSLADKVAGFPV